MTGLVDAVKGAVALGGPVVAVLALVSVLTVAVILYKLWQFRAAGVGRHRALRRAVAHWDAGARAEARRDVAEGRSYLQPLFDMAMSHHGAEGIRARLEAEAETRFARLERGFRYLDSVAQLAPLMGLFGTVLGMIEAFQSLQAAGAQVDPSLLAGGIWVALLTTAVGLGVAMPTSVVLSWLESRMAAERVIAEQGFSAILTPAGERTRAAGPAAHVA
ncbi:MotA/TolQ/ExbB proton channel family protein [Seohaeicola zhoushanensis]|uniref:Flagellar motor protein MotA n=1 Tax=Seohaeicola zhoushanensis TaxID=1569283 RepID=A0A8J3M7F1_9RHOB|nr:MotA/TolQ/ExbB proton channel family protein [Seohaeicola zhoushanensis]GHF45866.1 flagellar motor protein MotA [Seohaeicola zhoushanensis]